MKSLIIVLKYLALFTIGLRFMVKWARKILISHVKPHLFQLRGRNFIRKMIAISIVIVFLLGVFYVIHRDLFVEEKVPYSLRVRLQEMVYHFTLQSFDFQSQVVRGNLKATFLPDLPMVGQPAPKYRFGPLVYRDGALDFLLSGLRSGREIDIWTSFAAQTKAFKEQKPSPITFELQALGQPKFYPFDLYLLVGGVKCMVLKEDERGELKVISTEGKERIAVTQNIPGFMIRYPRFHEVKGIGFEPPDDQIEALNFDKWNKGHAFLLVLDRPLFLRVMTILIGAVALLSMAYITVLRPPSDLLINSIGYVIAVWAMREILSGGTEVFPTLIDYGTLMLYSFLIVAALAKTIWRKKSS